MKTEFAKFIDSISNKRFHAAMKPFAIAKFGDN